MSATQRKNTRSLLMWLFIGLSVVILALGLASYVTVKSVQQAFSFDRFGAESSFESRGNAAVLEITGAIMSAESTLQKVSELEANEAVQAVVVRINSPGGAVAPSQEIYNALRRLSDVKPVVCSLADLAASGGYYIAVGCQRIFANPGTLTGSIGVIMQLHNLEELYNWAKVDPLVLKAGRFKDIGSETRKMNPAERDLLQNMLDTVHEQFKNAIYEGRNSALGAAASATTTQDAPPAESTTSPNQDPDPMSEQQDTLVATTPPPENMPEAVEGLSFEIINEYGDGRIMTGEEAQRLSFVDALGGLHEATLAAAEMAGLGANEVQLRRELKARPGFRNFFDFLGAVAGVHSSALESSGNLSQSTLGLDSILASFRKSLQGGLDLSPGVPYLLPSHIVDGGISSR